MPDESNVECILTMHSDPKSSVHTRKVACTREKSPEADALSNGPSRHPRDPRHSRCFESESLSQNSAQSRGASLQDGFGTERSAAGGQKPYEIQADNLESPF